MFGTTKKGLARKLDELESTEAGNGAITVEYVIIICVIVGLGAALFAFQEQIKKFLDNTATNLQGLFTKLNAGQVQ